MRIRNHEEKTAMRPHVQWGLFFLASFLLIGLSHLSSPGVMLLADSLLGDKHQAGGIKCASCHREDPPKNKVPNGVCLSCHQDGGKLAERTQKVVPNPHSSPHLDPGTPPACDECHHIHKPSTITCIQCHPDFKFRTL